MKNTFKDLAGLFCCTVVFGSTSCSKFDSTLGMQTTQTDNMSQSAMHETYLPFVAARPTDVTQAKTNIFFQNLGNRSATVQAKFYAQASGQLDWETDPMQVPALGSGRFLFPNFVLPDNWQGSVKLSSDQPVAAAVNAFWDIPNAGATYKGIQTPSNNLHFSAVSLSQDETTIIYVQNTDDVATDAKAQFFDATGSIICEQTVPLAANASELLTMDCTSEEKTPDGQYGSLVVNTITGSKALAGIAFLQRASSVIAYSADMLGGDEILFPSVFRRMGEDSKIKLSSELFVQNTSQVAANIALDFQGIPGDAQANWTQVLPSQSSFYIDLSVCDESSLENMCLLLGDDWQGSVTVTADKSISGMSIYSIPGAGVIDQIGYDAILKQQSTNQVFMPATYRKISGPQHQFSTTLIQNLEETDGTVNVRFFASNGSVRGNPDGYDVQLPKASSVRLNLKAGLELPAQALLDLGDIFSGAMLVTAAEDQKIAGVTFVVYETLQRASGYSGFVFKEPEKTGSLSVYTTPQGARLFLDSEDTGKTAPHLFEHLAVGKHLVKAVWDNRTEAMSDAYVGLDLVTHITLEKPFVCPDEDQDGFESNACGGMDCDDQDARIHPNATETCDGLDNNCNDLVDEDLGEITCGEALCTQTVPACKNGEAQECVPLDSNPDNCEDCDSSPNMCQAACGRQFVSEGEYHAFGDFPMGESDGCCGDDLKEKLIANYCVGSGPPKCCRNNKSFIDSSGECVATCLSKKKGVAGWTGIDGTDYLSRLNATWGFNWNWWPPRSILDYYHPAYRFVPMIAGEDLQTENRQSVVEKISLFVNRVRYESTERYWLVGNEPNVYSQDAGKLLGTPCEEKTTEAYAWAVSAIKAQDPYARVILGGIFDADRICAQKLVDHWQGDICNDIDGWHVHLYDGSLIPAIINNWKEWVRNFELQCNKNMETWITEFGTLWRSDQRWIADNLMEPYVNLFENDPEIDRYSWFYSSINNHPGEPIPGLYDPDAEEEAKPLTELGQRYRNLVKQ